MQARSIGIYVDATSTCHWLEVSCHVALLHPPRHSELQQTFRSHWHSTKALHSQSSKHDPAV
eukprot:c27376_g3_i1 orf=360-545(+)